MKPRQFATRPQGTRGVQIRDVPLGTVVMDRWGDWGVVLVGHVLDRWHGPATKLEPRELVLVPYETPITEPNREATESVRSVEAQSRA